MSWQQKNYLHLNLSNYDMKSRLTSGIKSRVCWHNTPLAEGGGASPPLKDCIQAAACYGGMHVGKHASKKVAPLKQNIPPPATDDTPLFTHSLAPRICFTLTFIFQDECLKSHWLKLRKLHFFGDCFMFVDIELMCWNYFFICYIKYIKNSGWSLKDLLNANYT